LRPYNYHYSMLYRVIHVQVNDHCRNEVELYLKTFDEHILQCQYCYIITVNMPFNIYFIN